MRWRTKRTRRSYKILQNFCKGTNIMNSMSNNIVFLELPLFYFWKHIIILYWVQLGRSMYILFLNQHRITYIFFLVYWPMYFPIYNHSECKTMHYDALNYANLIYKNTNVFNKKKIHFIRNSDLIKCLMCQRLLGWFSAYFYFFLSAREENRQILSSLGLMSSLTLEDFS